MTPLYISGSCLRTDFVKRWRSGETISEMRWSLYLSINVFSVTYVDDNKVFSSSVMNYDPISTDP